MKCRRLAKENCNTCNSLVLRSCCWRGGRKEPTMEATPRNSTLRNGMKNVSMTSPPLSLRKKGSGIAFADDRCRSRTGAHYYIKIACINTQGRRGSQLSLSTLRSAGCRAKGQIVGRQAQQPAGGMKHLLACLCSFAT